MHDTTSWVLRLALLKYFINYAVTEARVKRYVDLALSSLSRMISHARFPCNHPAHKAGRHTRWATYVLEKFPQLWQTVADFPDLIETDGCDSDEEQNDDDGGYRINLIELALGHNALSLEETYFTIWLHLRCSGTESVLFRGSPPNMLDTMGPYVTLLCWMYGRAADVRNESPPLPR
jgi:hypothetical protein